MELKLKLKLFSTLLLLLSSNAFAKVESFDVDPVHTRVAFQVSHAGFSNALGTFSGSTGKLQFDELDWGKSSITVTIPIGSLNLGDDNWQKKILDGTFFDVGKYPSASFVSQRIEKLSDNTGIAHGTLTIRGIGQPAILNFTLNALKRHPLSFKKTIGFSATASLSRKAFGMNAWNQVIGDEVKVIIELEATATRSDKTREPQDADSK
ncbi:MAG: YceI family protein [Arenimonas sp.]